jgi:hypothetical protein
MKLLCLVTGHRWRVGDGLANEETVLRCTRCGKQRVSHPGTPPVGRGGSLPDAAAMNLAQDLHRNEHDG